MMLVIIVSGEIGILHGEKNLKDSGKRMEKS